MNSDCIIVTMFSLGLVLISTFCFSSSLASIDEFSHLSSDFPSVESNSLPILRNVPMTGEGAKSKSREEVEKYMKSFDAPGMVVGISVNGKNEWMEAFGEIDIENHVPTHIDSAWRLASISKSISTALVGKLIDQGKLELDASIYKYLSTDIYPRKTFRNKTVDITLKQALSHTGGFRISVYPDELYTVVRRDNVTQTIAQFKDEPLIHEPGTAFAYSNYGFQIVGAVIESVLKRPYEHAINELLGSELNMTSTFVERLEHIIPRRSRYYMRKAKDVHSLEYNVINTDIMDQLSSLEGWWVAGGIMSTISDQLKFGNHMLKSYHDKNGFLKQSTVRKLWTPIKQPLGDSNSHYAEGWVITNLTEPIKCPHNDCKTPPIKNYVFNAGALYGTSTILMIFPEQNFVVSILSNIGLHSEKMFLNSLGLSIASNFML